MILSLLFFFLAACCYGITSLWNHKKLKWSQQTNGGVWPNAGFWGEESWRRKYTFSYSNEAPENWYYRFFKIKYKERFPLSATALVFLTDGFHLTQFVMIKLLILSVICYTGPLTWTVFFAAWILWVAGFQLTYLKLHK